MVSIMGLFVSAKDVSGFVCLQLLQGNIEHSTGASASPSKA